MIDKIVQGVIGITFVIAFTAGASVFLALVIWKVALRSKPIRFPEAILIFCIGACSACGVYGHAMGPVIFLFLSVSEARAAAVFWAISVGALATGFVLWQSHRRSRNSN